MKALRAALAAIRAVFVEEASLAAFAAVLILVIAGAVKILDVPPLWGALALLVGVLAILVESLARARQAARATRTARKH